LSVVVAQPVAPATQPPTAVTLHAVLAHGASRSVSVRSLAFGELVFKLRISSDRMKHVVVRVRRAGSSRPIRVFDVGSSTGAAGCRGAAGSLVCGPAQVPAPHPARWIVTISNPGGRADVTLSARFHRLKNAG
jgi:hypothetical protein